MKNAVLHFSAMHKHPGFLTCTTSKSYDPFWGGKRYCDLHTQIIQTISIQSFQVGRQEYLIAKNKDQNNRVRLIRTKLFIN